MASYKEKYLVKYLVTGSASNSLTYASISSYGLWCNVSCLLHLVPGPCRLQCLARSQQCPWICGAAAAVRSFAGLFFLKLTYLGRTCRRSKMIPFLLIWIHMSESGDELGPIFAVHEDWIFWTHDLNASVGYFELMNWYFANVTLMRY